jgi:RNA-splicing ligase RtcB
LRTGKVITHHTRKAFEKALGMSAAEVGLRTVYEVTHNSAANHFHQVAIFLPLTSFPSNLISRLLGRNQSTKRQSITKKRNMKKQAIYALRTFSPGSHIRINADFHRHGPGATVRH